MAAAQSCRQLKASRARAHTSTRPLRVIQLDTTYPLIKAPCVTPCTQAAPLHLHDSMRPLRASRTTGHFAYADNNALHINVHPSRGWGARCLLPARAPRGPRDWRDLAAQPGQYPQRSRESKATVDYRPSDRRIQNRRRPARRARGGNSPGSTHSGYLPPPPTPPPPNLPRVSSMSARVVSSRASCAPGR
jgi:hypothetical protein